MNHKGTTVAAAIALAIASGAAMAAGTPADTDILRMGGASATDRTLFELMVDLSSGVCLDTATDGAGVPLVAGATADLYTTATSWDAVNPGPGNFTIYCTGRTIGGGALPIGVAKFSGGSETGIEPVRNGTISYTLGSTTAFVTYADPTSGTCSAVPTVVPRSTVTGADRIAYRVFTNCGKTSTAPSGIVPHPLAPQAGQSDVNPELFGYASSGNQLATDPAAAQGFAVVVSQNFYSALQAGLTDGGGNPCNSLVANQVPSCIPNLSIGQIHALMSGRYSSVASIYVNGANLVAPAGGAAPRICSRSQTSGTRASVEIAYFGQRCSPVAPTFTLATETSATDASGNACNAVGCVWDPTKAVQGASPVASGVTVFSGNGTGEVEKCLDHANDNNIYALGIMSMDRIPNDSSKQFRYIKIDGVLPIVENLVAQKFNYYTEAVLLKPAAPSVNQPAFAAGNRTAIYNAVLGFVRNPSFLPKTHSVNAWGRGGLAGRPFASGSTPAVTDTASGRAVNGTIRSTSATLGAVNDCNTIGIPASYPIKE